MNQVNVRAGRGKGSAARTAIAPFVRGDFAPTRIAIIGSGATAVYALKHLLSSSTPLAVHIFEREREIGTGMPYRMGVNLPQMLSNIGSRELPPVVQTLEEYLSSCDGATLREFGIAREDIGPETFYPRVVLGRYFMAQIAALIARARGTGHPIEIRHWRTVTDIQPSSGRQL